MACHHESVKGKGDSILEAKSGEFIMHSCPSHGRRRESGYRVHKGSRNWATVIELYNKLHDEKKLFTVGSYDTSKVSNYKIIMN